MKVLNRSIKFFFIALALVLLALLAFVVTFDANNYRPQIIEQVENATGRDFSIDGDINLSLFPWVGLKVENVALGNEAGFKEKQFAAIKQLDIKVNVLPLLKKEVQINTIRLHGLKVSLEVAADKSNNWSSLSQPETTAESSEVETKDSVKQKEKKQTTESKETTASPLQSLKVEGFEFIDATIRYDDRSSNTTAKISELNLTTSAITFDEAVDVIFSARIESSQPEVDTQLKLTTQLIFNQAFTKISLQDLTFTVLAKANEFIAQEEQIEIKSSIDISMDDQRVVVKRLQLSALGVTTLADITVSQFLSTPLIQGEVEVQPFNAREVAQRAGMELPVMAKTDALNKVALTTKIKLRGNEFEANDFIFMLDDSTMMGWLRMPSLSKQTVRYDLVFDRLNINDYLPPEVVSEIVAENEVGETEKNATAAINDADSVTGDEKIELPIQMMRELDIQGEFKIAELTAKEYEIKQLLMSLKVGQGVIAIEPLSMQVLEGQVEMAVNLNVQKEVPAYTIDLNASQIEIGPVANPFLINAMGEKPLQLDGAVNLTMNIKTAGDSVNQLKKSSKGKIVFDMKETRVDGFDPEYYMRKSVADYAHSIGFGLSKTVMGKYTPRDVTVFDTIYSTVNLANGKARTDDFLMDSKRVKVTAKGYTDIMNNTVDMISSMQLPRAKTSLEKIFDEPVFVHVYGPFDALQYDLDKKKLKKSTSGVLNNEVKAKLDAKKQKLKDQAEAKKNAAEKKAKKKLKKSTDKYKDKLKDKLKGLF